MTGFVLLDCHSSGLQGSRGERGEKGGGEQCEFAAGGRAWVVLNIRRFLPNSSIAKIRLEIDIKWISKGEQTGMIFMSFYFGISDPDSR